jgi:hypothetical protein
MTRSPAYGFIKERVELEFQKLEKDKVTPWAFFLSGKELGLTNFLGKEIRYSGIGFEGSPRTVFWKGFIQPFLQDITSRSFSETRSFCLAHGLEPKQPMEETASLLKTAINNIYERMSDIDQRLRGKGFPKSVPKYDAIAERARSEAFVEERLAAELSLGHKKVEENQMEKNQDSYVPVYHVFIAHSDNDQALAVRLEHELRLIFGNSIKVFNSSNPSTIKGGKDWFHYITDEHKKAKLGLLMITNSAVDNLWIAFEAGGFFLRKESVAIPVFFSTNDIIQLSFPLAGIQGKKLWQKESREALIAEISQHIGMPAIDYDDSRFVSNVVSQYSTDNNTISNKDLIQIRKEAMAALRSANPDYRFFERKLNEIDLVESASALDKLNTIAEIGMEVTLNSGKATEILLGQLSWFLPERTTDKTIISKVSEILWSWGLQVVEYQRNIAVVKAIIQVMKRVHTESITYGIVQATKNCTFALASMMAKAQSDNLQEIYQYLISENLGEA